MKEIEREEQLKKKQRQTAEETAIADSENEKMAAEQETEITLSEEEIDAMYARFCQRLQDEGLADAEGNPTEKTVQLRRRAVEEENARKEREQKREMVKKKVKTTNHWVRAAKAAGVVIVVGACVFGASMTSEANRIRLVETVHGVWNTGDTTGINNGENREYSAGSLDEAVQEIKDKLHIAVPEFYYIPTGMKYSKTVIMSDIQMASIEYQYNKQLVYFRLAANEKDLSQGSWKDKEKVQVETFDDTIEVEMGTIAENNEENYYATWKYKDAYYQLSGQIEKEELIKILNEMQYNL